MSIEFDEHDEKLIMKGVGHHYCSVSLHLFRLAFVEYVVPIQDVPMDEEEKENYFEPYDTFILFLHKIGVKSPIPDQFIIEYEDNKFTFKYKIDTLNMIFEMGYNEVILSVDLINPATHLQLCQELLKILNYVQSNDDNDDL